MKSGVYGSFAAAILFAATSALAQDNMAGDADETGEGFTIEDVAFLAGHWIGMEGNPGAEEGWFGPADGVMTAIFRWPSARGRYVVEALTIREEVDGVFFRFRHFDPDLTPWEKEGPNTYRLESVEGGCATFAGTHIELGGPTNIQYCLTEDDHLVFRGGSAGENIKNAQFKLEFTRKP